MLARRVAQLVLMGMPIICWKTFLAKKMCTTIDKLRSRFSLCSLYLHHNTSQVFFVYSVLQSFKVSHSYRIWNVFAQPEVASEVRRTSHFVTSDVVSYPLRYFTVHIIPRLSEQVIWSMSDLSLLHPLKTKVDIAVLTGDRAT